MRVILFYKKNSTKPSEIWIQLWQLDEYGAKLQIAQQRIQPLTASLNQTRQNAQSYLATLEKLEGLIRERRKDVS